MGRRMAETAALLVEHRLSTVAWRQRVFSLPGSLTVRLGYDRALLDREVGASPPERCRCSGGSPSGRTRTHKVDGLPSEDTKSGLFEAFVLYYSEHVVEGDASVEFEVYEADDRVRGSAEVRRIVA
jgi:hypothetical protein